MFSSRRQREKMQSVNCEKARSLRSLRSRSLAPRCSTKRKGKKNQGPRGAVWAVRQARTAQPAPRGAVILASAGVLFGQGTSGNFRRFAVGTPKRARVPARPLDSRAVFPRERGPLPRRPRFPRSFSARARSSPPDFAATETSWRPFRTKVVGMHGRGRPDVYVNDLRSRKRYSVLLS